MHLQLMTSEYLRYLKFFDWLSRCRSQIVNEDEALEKTNRLKRAFDKTYWLWIVVIVFDLISQCLRSANMHADREAFISTFC